MRWLEQTIWNSLTSKFQLELLGQELEFSQNNEYDSVELWDHIRTEVNLSTKVGACALKEEKESKILQHFGMDVKSYNIWIMDTKNREMRQEGPKKSNEYIWYKFKTYLTSTHEEFSETIKDMKLKCIHNLLLNNYLSTDLMATVSNTLNNIIAEGGWTLVDRNGQDST